MGIVIMWFKNLVIYRLPADWSVSAAQLEDALAQRVLQACPAFAMRSSGFAFAGPAQRFVHTVQRQHLIALAVDQKLLPGSVIRQFTQERAAALAEEQGHPVGRRQMREVKESVTQELLARALTKRSITRAWIDPEHGRFIVDAASMPRAEEVVVAMRDALGSFAVQYLETEASPALSMNSWLMQGEAPSVFTLDQDLELQAADRTKASVRYAHHVLEGKDITAHLASGKYATRLGLTWRDRIAFLITEKLQIKRVQFLDIDKDKPEDAGRDATEQFDIDFSLMSGELAQLLGDLEQALGGQSQKKAA